MLYVFDEGHAESTLGKCSPDRRFREYKYNREIVALVGQKLDELGIRWVRTVNPSDPADKPLTKRAEAANAWARGNGAGNTILISVHSNAAGNGKQWMNAKGWAVYTTKGNTNSDKYATIFCEEAKKVCDRLGRKIRKDTSDGDPDFEENFTVIEKTICPSILIEEFFYDNLEEMEWLLSDEGRNACAEIIIDSILAIEGGTSGRRDV